MELNVNQKSVVKILYDTYKSNTVTRSEINDLVKSKKIKNPSWLKSDTFKVGRGVYKLPMGEDADVEDTPVETPKSDTKAAYIVSSLTDNVVPARDKDFVNFGNFSDVKNVITSKKFYPVLKKGMYYKIIYRVQIISEGQNFPKKTIRHDLISEKTN